MIHLLQRWFSSPIAKAERDLRKDMERRQRQNMPWICAHLAQLPEGERRERFSAIIEAGQ